MMSNQVRLQKVIAASGLASRRQAEQLIRDGHVTVNGQVVCQMGVCIDPAQDHVKVNGHHIKPAEPEVFLLLHKPAGYITSTKDSLGRPTIMDLLKGVRVRVFPVGRLDYDSEGLLLLTNNGRIAHSCLHPSYKMTKTYLVKIAGMLTNEDIRLLEKGVELADGPTAPARIKKTGKARVNSWIEITIHEGRKHQIKRMLEAVGHRVLRLRRIKFGPLSLGDLPSGHVRYLTDTEANALRAVLERQPDSSAQPVRADTAARARRQVRATLPGSKRTGRGSGKVNARSVTNTRRILSKSFSKGTKP